VRKAEALRLERGQQICFGASKVGSAECATTEVGTVLFVTKKGGLRAKVGDQETWVPYHHVVCFGLRVKKSAPRKKLRPR
jgi:hypothetical protein